jgi:hypothetical protein
MTTDRKEEGAPWWREVLSRRQANRRIAGIGVTAALLASAGITVVGCGSDDDDGDVKENDALELQKQKGWNAGADDAPLAFQNRTGTDSNGTLDWKSYLDPSSLMKAYQPKNSKWQPYVVPTLVQSLAQPSLRSQMQPVFSPSMNEAYSRGLGMREILQKSKNSGEVMIVSDIPGPEAVAYGAALADIADVVTTFDNWPHPLGVVPSHQTLGAMLYYAGEIAQKAAKRPDNAPAVLLLDSNRLAAYSDDSDKFDNRYIAKLPTSDNLTSMKVTSVMYAVPNESRTAELDDINEDFVAYKEKGINVSMLPLSDFQAPSAEVQDSLNRANASTLAGSTSTMHTTYYYGGHPMFSPWFFTYHPIFVPSYSYALGGRMAPPTIHQPNYQPVRRPTMFSSRTVGGTRSGIGKQKPSGFGRVSTRTSSSGRTFFGSSARNPGRSGSFGRSGGRGFG